MHQLEMSDIRTKTTIDVDGMVDRHGIKFIGLATLMGDGSYRCLADVSGCLCVVEVKITKVCDG